MRRDTTRRTRRRLAVPATGLAVFVGCLPLGAATPETDAAVGLRLAAEGRCPEAIDLLRRALREDESDCPVRTALGSCLLTLGRIERGERVLEDAATCADAEALEATALVAWRHRRLDLAGSLFERVAELAPERPELHAYLAQIRFGEGRLDESAASARRALEAHPDDVQMRGLLALALTRAGRDEEAVPELARYIEAVPQDAGARFLLARLHVRLGKRREAVEQLRRLVAEAPETPGAASLLGAGLYDLGDLEEARGVLESALTLDPEGLGLAALALGRVYAHQGLWDRAVEQLETAAEELGGEFPDGDLLEYLRGQAADR
jgi:tetratricopeptide (TPR) repeat protein